MSCGQVLAVGDDDFGELGLVDFSIAQRLGDDAVDIAALDGGVDAPGVQVEVVELGWLGHLHEHAAIQVGDVLGEVAGAGFLLEQAQLVVAERLAAGVLVGVVVELLQVEAQAGGGAFATAGVGADNRADHLAPRF